MKIRSFEVSLVVRAGDKELSLSQQFTDDKTYQNQRGQTIFEDEKGYESIFNGKDLTGWDGNPDELAVIGDENLFEQEQI